MKGFRDFLLKANLVSMAVALVMALAFETLVLAFVRAFVTPVIGLAAWWPWQLRRERVQRPWRPLSQELV